MSAQRTVVLVGAGHAHLYVAARAAEYTEQGVRPLLVDPGQFWYSGLATGMLGGMYDADEDQVDPQSLIEACGGEFIRDKVDGVDTAARRLRLASGETLDYDYLSINVGSGVNLEAIPGMVDDASLWSVKPVSNLWRLREHLETRFRSGDIPRVAVVGGGPTGSEVAANLAALSERHGVDLPLTLVSHSERLIKQAPVGAARALQRKLARRGVDIRLNTRIDCREGRALVTEDGRRIAADIVVLAIGLQANALVHEAGLPTRPKEGLRINAKLHSIADDRVFAGGDCAAMEGYDLPKLGVFGVRQAEYIHRNLLASLDGKTLSEYEPQRRYLAILNLGDGTALSTWGPFWWNGRSSQWLKDSIDRRFLDRYRRLYQS